MNKQFSRLTILLTLLLTGCGIINNPPAITGSAVNPSNVRYAPTKAANVEVLQSSELPKIYKVLGQVTANYPGTKDSPALQKAIIEQLKIQAASIGANGITNLSNNGQQTTADAIITF